MKLFQNTPPCFGFDVLIAIPSPNFCQSIREAIENQLLDWAGLEIIHREFDHSGRQLFLFFICKRECENIILRTKKVLKEIGIHRFEIRITDSTPD